MWEQSNDYIKQQKIYLAKLVLEPVSYKISDK
jgi:hypothetical protein